MEFQRLYNNICCALLQCMLRAKVGEKRLKVFELYVTGLQSFDKNENKKKQNKTKQEKQEKQSAYKGRCFVTFAHPMLLQQKLKLPAWPCETLLSPAASFAKYIAETSVGTSLTSIFS